MPEAFTDSADMDIYVSWDTSCLFLPMYPQGPYNIHHSEVGTLQYMHLPTTDVQQDIYA